MFHDLLVSFAERWVIKMKQKNIQTVQVLRGIACVAIVLFHLPSEWGGGGKS